MVTWFLHKTWGILENYSDINSVGIWPASPIKQTTEDLEAHPRQTEKEAEHKG